MMEGAFTLAGIDPLILAGVALVAFVARWMLKRFSPRVHLVMMDALVIAGGASFLWRAWEG